MCLGSAAMSLQQAPGSLADDSTSLSEVLRGLCHKWEGPPLRRWVSVHTVPCYHLPSDSGVSPFLSFDFPWASCAPGCCTPGVQVSPSTPYAS